MRRSILNKKNNGVYLVCYNVGVHYNDAGGWMERRLLVYPI
jgi:hypothetical protein